jgi:hypothetical protein
MRPSWKARVLRIDPHATCKLESERADSPNSVGLWATVRDGSGKLIGQHRRPVHAWRAAYDKLGAKR